MMMLLMLTLPGALLALLGLERVERWMSGR
jgi:hypothetical protein